jgi:hypothetical protein
LFRSTPPLLFSLNHSLPLPINQQLSVNIVMSSTCTCNAFQYCWLSIILFFLPPPVLHSSFAITNMLGIWMCIWSYLFIGVCLSFRSVFHTFKKSCSLCLSKPGLFHLTWLPTVPLNKKIVSGKATGYEELLVRS